jgi:diguanylate cyclase (GGDEF)-like protein/putative nucleotidyltransferase with HDIG domain
MRIGKSKDIYKSELTIANKELAFQNEEKEKRAAELIIANKELAFQNEEKEKRAAELIIANKELAFQNEEKEKRAAELIIANTKLKQRNALIEGLFNHMTSGVAIYKVLNDGLHGSDYIIKDMNDTSLRWENKSRDEAVGKSIIELHPNIENLGIIEVFRKVWIIGEPIIFPMRQYLSGDYNRWHENRIFKLPSNEIVAVYDDITERVFIENQRDKEQRDLLATQKFAKLGTWRLDVKTNKVTWSEELYKMYGFDPTQSVPPYTEHMKLFTKRSWARLSSALALTRTQGIPYELELEMVSDGIPKGWMWVRGEAEFDDQGNIVALTGAAQDITKRKQLEENLKEANQIARLGRWELIHNEHRLVWSETVFDIYEIDSNRFESSYESFLKLIHPDDRSIVDEAYKGSFMNKQACSIEHRLLMNDGRIKWVIEKCNTEFDEKGRPIRSVGIVQDITEKKIKEEENIYIANHDYLTNLYNRRYFVNAFNTFFLNNCYPIVLMIIDINGLKIINDAYGYLGGDEAIRQVANLLMKTFDQNDVVARIGGDEFAILSPKKNAVQIQAYKEKLVLLSQDIKIENTPISLAIGYEVLNDNDRDLDELLSRAEKQLYRHKLTVGESVRNNAIKAILNTLTAKYKEEKMHSAHVSQLCKEIGTELGLSKEEVDVLELAGMYHDIGKISIPDAILNKPDKLTDEEYEIIKTHTQIGYQILRAADEYSGLAEYALSHHERWDGKGYPKGLKGKEIPLFSRIINVADSFEAMTADRPYHKGRSIEDAIIEIKQCSGTQFDPEIAKIFMEKVFKYKR